VAKTVKFSGRMRLGSDDSGHQYIVPVELYDEFNRLMQKIEDGKESKRDYSRWYDVFESMRLGAHISCYSFTDLRLDDGE
jgi:hypothetical protein